MTRLKIGIDARSLCYKQRGMPTYVFYLCQYLPDLMDADFYFFINTAFEHNEHPSDYQHRIDACKRDNVTFVDVLSDEDVKWEQSYLPKKVSEFHLDLIHLPCNRTSLRAKTKQIVTYHDVMEWKHLNLFSFPEKGQSFSHFIYCLKRKLYRWAMYRLGLKHADHVLTISNYAQSSILSTFPNVSNKISYVYHGVPENYLLDKTRYDLSERAGVLMLGGESYQKNWQNMLDAYRKLPEHVKLANKLYIAGIANTTDGEIVKYIRSTGMEDYCEIHGWIDEQLLLSLFSKVRVLLFASREEGFGFPLLQAMARETPAVVSNAKVLIEIGEEAVFSADAEDSEALMRATHALLTDDTCWHELSAAGKKRTQGFTWSTAAKAVAAAYKQVLETK
ncbi:glycosyltransferase family 4 protein [Agaribacter marinus]|uniref:Uncharacterized protein n=1 Tax=Agaribacter marinus TaxID=1431249 RepID=A0AA37SWG0_9ALTE|nr:glycosyltransferase family 1 protein [Agaribacter marinus]GLR70933.1 hypothetical protein GCM10007852_18410 [Agaribacter marinus]